MATEGRVTGGLSPGEQIRTVELSTTASDEGAPSTKNQQVLTIGDPDTVARLAQVGSDRALVVASAARATYSCTTGPIAGATATGTKVLAYLWHPSGVALRYDLLAVNVSQIAGAGPAGAQRLELRKITAENGTPGGTTGNLLAHDGSQAASGATVRIAPTGAPTIATGVLAGGDVPVTIPGNAYFPPFRSPQLLEYATPYVARASTAEGYVVTQEVVSTLTTAPSFNITWTWAEVTP
jgi:hypothetical protein